MSATLFSLLGHSTSLLRTFPKEVNMICLADNIHKCQWGNKNAAGYQDGGWSDLYEQCELYEIPEV
jgi:hypothetical protein